MLETLAVPVINRVLRGNTWALDKLRPHAGKTVYFSSPPFSLHVEVTEAGEVVAAPADASAALTIVASPGAMLRLIARDEEAWKALEVSGDIHLAAAIDQVRRGVVWDYEEDLSRVFGDIAAHRMAGALRELDRWGRATLTNLGLSLAEYATYEQPVVASAPALRGFSRDVDQLRDDVSRLQERIAALRLRIEARATGTP